MLYAYIGCLTFGAFYAFLSMLFGGHGFDHGALSHGGIHAGGTADTHDVPSPFNPLVIASAITAFGAAGLIGKLAFRMGDISSLILSLLVAVSTGAVIFFGIVKLLYGSQSNSIFSREQLVGKEGEILTPLSADCMGEVAYSLNGVRGTLPAKSENGEELKKGDSVVIIKMEGSTAHVVKKISLDAFTEE